MSADSHFRFGYLVQIISLLTLSVTNILLPNVLGALEFAKLNEAYAFVGFSCVVFNEGVAVLVIRAIRSNPGNVRHARNLALQASFEHSLLTLPALAALMFLTAVLKPNHHYAIGDWSIVATSGIVFGLYVPVVAWLNAMLRNQWVAILAIAQGTLSCVLPLAAVSIGLDVRWSICTSYFFGLVTCAVLLRRIGPIEWRPSFSLAHRVCVVPALVAVSAPTAMRIAIIWLPVLVLAANGKSVDSAAYKIGMSFGLGICALVPFHRQTMLSLDDHNGPLKTAQLAAGAIQIATICAAAMILFAEPIVEILYRVEFNAIVHYLHVFGFFVVLQVLTDVLLVRLISMRADRTLVTSCGISIAAAAYFSHSNYPLEWLPALTLAIFVISACLLQRRLLGGSLVLRSAAVGIVCVAAVVFVTGWVGILGVIASYAVVLMHQTQLRMAMGRSVSQLLGRT